MMLNIIVMIVIFASIISAVIYMSSSSMRQAASSNQSANAWNLAETGYRFLSTNYLNTLNVSGNADGDKADFLSSINNRKYVVGNGSFTLAIRPYWFYNLTGATGTITTVTVQLPGTTPANFTMPAAGLTAKIKLGDTPGVQISDCTVVSFNSGTGVFTCTLTSPGSLLNRRDSVYLVLNPDVNQTVNRGQVAPDQTTLTLNIGNYTASAFPAKDGFVEIGTETRLYRYSYANLSGSVLTLTNLQHSDKSAFSTPVTTATTVTFKKYIKAQSTGQVGPELRTLSFNQAIFDSTIALPPVVVKLDTAAQLSANFSQSSSIASYEVTTLLTSGGGSAAFSVIDTLATTGSGATAYQCGAFWYNGTSTINTQWAPPANNYLLSYDVQVKPSTGNALTAGTIGLAIRAKKVSSTTEPDTYLGLTFMKYYLPNLYFTLNPLLFLAFTNGGTTAINSGDTVVGASSGATGVVQGTPVLTSGTWAGGDAAGIIIFSSVTGTFSAGEWLRVGGVNRAKVGTLLLFTNGGTTAINSGDTVVGASSGATGVVQGTPVLTAGTWAGGDAAGKIIFASVAGTFSAGEWLRVGGVNRAKVSPTINLFNPGDTLTGASSGATGVVQGTPELTSGSWAGGDAKGKIRFASVTGTFSANERLIVGGVPTVQVNGGNYFACAYPPCTANSTDYIPQAIKPKPSDFASFPSNPFYSSRYNIGPLLLVLWERKVDAVGVVTFRWLAFKDISNDDYTKGLQDFVEPTGSCTNPPSSCPGNDGQIIDDNASIYVRIQEKRVNLGTGLVKVNDINLFYGDATSRYVPPTWPARPGNAIPYDIKELRRSYILSDNFANVIWVPPYISQWDQPFDYFSHIESGTPLGSQPQFQWDAVNPSPGSPAISTLKICDDGSAACTSATNGTLRLTELVTPDSGTYYQPEVGTLACGALRNNGQPDYATAGFAEFALKIFSAGGGTAGGFLGGSISW
jgi:hypothetical protein